GLERVVLHHPDLALDQPAPARGADPALARVRKLAPHSKRGVEHSLVPAHHEAGLAPVQGDGDLGALRGGLIPSRGLRLPLAAAALLGDMEEFSVDARIRYVAFGEHTAN